MDQDADRRRMNRLGAHRPLLERPEGRSVEWEKRLRAKVARQTFDQPSAPAVKRMVGPVARLRTGGERIPALAPGHARKHDRPHVRERASLLIAGEEESAARNKAG